MALIVCPECQGKVSSTCDVCPHCGYRLSPSRGRAIFKCSEPQFGSWIRWTCKIVDVATEKVLAKFSQGDSFVMNVDKEMVVQTSIFGFFEKPIVKLLPGQTKEIIISARMGHVEVQEIIVSGDLDTD